MTKSEFLEIIRGIPGSVEIGLNTICDENGEFTLSPVCEVHYDKDRNKICITPERISI